MVFRELSFSRLECGVHDKLHIYPLCGIFYFPWHRQQIEGTNGFYCLIRKTERFTISNVESQVFTPNNSRLDPGSNPGCPRDKRMSYHWTNCASLVVDSTLSLFYMSVGAMRGCVEAVAVCVASQGGCAWVRFLCLFAHHDVLCAVMFRLGASCFLPEVFARCASPSQ